MSEALGIGIKKLNPVIKSLLNWENLNIIQRYNRILEKHEKDQQLLPRLSRLSRITRDNWTIEHEKEFNSLLVENVQM